MCIRSGFQKPQTSRNLLRFPTVYHFSVGVTGITLFYEPLEINGKWCMSLPYFSNGSKNRV